MNVTDTKPLEKTCSKCFITKISNMFIPNRNICKECRNKNSRERYCKQNENITQSQKCSICLLEKSTTEFIKNRKICKTCNNNKRRDKYNSNIEHRIKTIEQSSNFKKNKIIERNIKLELEIGINNKKCKYCELIKPKERFRHNRLKCKDCEREEPISKLIRNVRSRIISAIKTKNKHTIEYLGCNCNSYLKWLLTNNKNYTYDNHGTEWHIDHVIPLSKFNIMDENEQMIAFNWRNTMPLSVIKNLSKNNKIIKEQVTEHFENLKRYHQENNIELPKEYIDLFAKHLDDGKPLKSLLPLNTGNYIEELG
jgi:hypothetical protein